MRYLGFDKPSFGLKTLGFGSEFTPLDLFANGEQGIWLDPSDLSTMFQDVGGTIAVTQDGDPVALIKDKSGNNNHATPPTSAARPVYRTDGNLHWLDFDGIDDTLKFNGDFLSDSDYTLSHGASVNDAWVQNIFSSFKNGRRRSPHVYISNLSQIKVGHYGDDIVGVLESKTDPLVITGQFIKGSKRVIEVNKTKIRASASANPLLSPIGDLYLAYNANNRYNPLKYYGGIMLNKAIDTLDLQEYLINKTGVIL